MKNLLRSFLLLIFGTITMAEDVDLFEASNRVVFEFNQALDENFFEPIARTYKESIPKTMQNRVSDFSSNLNDIYTLGNEILQFKLFDSVSTFGRILVNSTIGLVGLFDVASDIGLEKTNEDFGQTMAVWGVSSGPYVVLPVLGPSTMRDSTGTYVDITENIDVTKELNTTEEVALLLAQAVDTRVKLLPVTVLLKNSDDVYIATRSSYLQKRQFDIFDGNPPIENDDF
ncbi:VacJ family lipoprotein [Candidatus Ruthia magnifica str. Cm (Calyptogena magnifica)]|uniref:VacJ family lipoprotein n=1 Tax=Ruthia magnifica subsp. Calyptogena magnifica TaxID=413404 RepID=A1AXD4_RUTMC|nr:VacJ family lipoprotein [Candidatus Ruthturnera calyptogenae]ABL02591.1 VacJ family lipoprotein [Candidatus Ruthia magnifica str. Cm (Calyptogena magnifica)]